MTSEYGLWTLSPPDPASCSTHDIQLSISYHFRTLFGDIIGDNVGDLIDGVMKLDIANEARASCQWNSKTGFSGHVFRG